MTSVSVLVCNKEINGSFISIHRYDLINNKYNTYVIIFSRTRVYPKSLNDIFLKFQIYFIDFPFLIAKHLRIKYCRHYDSALDAYVREDDIMVSQMALREHL